MSVTGARLHEIRAGLWRMLRDDVAAIEEQMPADPGERGRHLANGVRQALLDTVGAIDRLPVTDVEGFMSQVEVATGMLIVFVQECYVQANTIPPGEDSDD